MGFVNSINGKIILGFIAAILVMIAYWGTYNMNVYSTVVWLHVLAGIQWIGLLYYFNFVQVPAMEQLLQIKMDQGLQRLESMLHQEHYCGSEWLQQQLGY